MRLNTQQLHVVRALTCQDSELTIVNCTEFSLTKNERVLWGCKSTHCPLLYLGSHKFMHVQTCIASSAQHFLFLYQTVSLQLVKIQVIYLQTKPASSLLQLF